VVPPQQEPYQGRGVGVVLARGEQVHIALDRWRAHKGAECQVRGRKRRTVVVARVGSLRVHRRCPQERRARGGGRRAVMTTHTVRIPGPVALRASKLKPRWGRTKERIVAGVCVAARVARAGTTLFCGSCTDAETTSPGIAVSQLRISCSALPSRSRGCTEIGVLAGTRNSAEPSGAPAPCR